MTTRRENGTLGHYKERLSRITATMEEDEEITGRKLLHKLRIYFLSSNFRNVSEFFQFLKYFICFLSLRLSYSLSLLHRV